MMHLATPEFWDCYNRLPDPIRSLADRNFQLLKSNSRHPSLHFKKVGRFWSARVGMQYRALAVESGEDLLWFWIGVHADYDHVVQR